MNLNVARLFTAFVLAAGFAEREADTAVQSGQTLSFQDGALPTAAYDGTRDATLSEDAPTAKLGTAATCSVDGDDPLGGGKDLVTLLKWDLSAIPQGSVVLSAQIELHVANASADSYELYRMSRDWTESTSTWNECETGTSWDAPGASGALDRGITARGEVHAAAQGPVLITLGPDGITAVQAWVDGPSVNYGFILANGANSDGLAFASREASVPSQRPRLIVTYMAQSGTTAGGTALPDGGHGFCGATGLETVLVLGLLALIRRLSPGK